MPVIRTDSEMDDVRNDAMEIVDERGTKWAGMSYEQGVADTIAWLVGDRDENPLEEN